MPSIGNTRDWKPALWTALALAVVLGATGLRGTTIPGDSPLGKLLQQCDCICSEDDCETGFDKCTKDDDSDPTGDTHGTRISSGPIEFKTIFDAQDTKPPITLQMNGPPASVAVAPPPPGAGTPGTQSVSLWEKLFRPVAAALSPRMYILTSNQIYVMDIVANRLLPSIAIPAQAGQRSNAGGRMGISPDGRFLYVAVAHTPPPNGILVVDTSVNRVVAEIPVTGDPSGVVLTEDGATAYLVNYVMGPTGHSILVVDTAARKVVTSIALDNFLPDPFGLTLTPDGNTLYVAGAPTSQGDFAVMLAIDTATNTVATRVRTPPFPFAGDSPVVPVVHPNGTKLYASGRTSILVLDTLTNDWVGRILIPEPRGLLNPKIRISSNGRRLYVSSRWELSLYKISTITETITGRIKVGTEPPNSPTGWGIIDFVLLR